VTARSQELKLPLVVAILDRHANLVLHVRMKGALLGSVDLALQKARGSALFPFPTSAFKMLPGIELSNGVIGNLGGGVPLITKAGVHVGSIGISGAPMPGLDEEIANLAVAEVDRVLETYW